EALVKVFGDAPPTLERQGGATTATPTQPATGGGPEATATPTTVPPAGQATLQQLLNEADTHFNMAQTALQAGDLAGYQREINAARDAIRRAQAQASTTATTRVGA